MCEGVCVRGWVGVGVRIVLSQRVPYAFFHGISHLQLVFTPCHPLSHLHAWYTYFPVLIILIDVVND